MAQSLKEKHNTDFRWVAILVGVELLLIGANAMAIEKPKFEVVTMHPGFELRRYQPYLVAETEVTGDFDEVGSQAFRNLTAYISGENRSGENGDDRAGYEAPDGQRWFGYLRFELRHAVQLQPG